MHYTQDGYIDAFTASVKLENLAKVLLLIHDDTYDRLSKPEHITSQVDEIRRNIEALSVVVDDMEQLAKGLELLDKYDG